MAIYQYPIKYSGPMLQFVTYKFTFENPKIGSSKGYKKKSPLNNIVKLYAPKDISFGFENTYEEAVLPTLQGIDTGLAKLGSKAFGGATKAIKAAMGKTFAPNDVLIYDKTSNIEMKLSFEMVPNNKKEAQNIADIVDFFKTAGIPDYKNKGGIMSAFNVIVTFPDIFSIHLINTGSADTSSVISQDYMALTSYNVSYGSDDDEAYYTFSDGQPVKTTLELDFRCVLPYLLESANQKSFKSSLNSTPKQG
jgi:hypothetical protein